jgi:hypothetical protein
MTTLNGNDIESLLFIEDMFEESGRLDGEKHGKIQAWENGFVLGLKQGWKMAKEIGYYKGFALYFLQKYKSAESEAGELERIERHLSDLLGLCIAFSSKNDDNLDPHGLIAKIRTKFRLCRSFVKSSQGFQKQESLSF